MKYLFMTLILLSPITAKAIDCSKHKIFCKIKELNSSVNDKYAMRLSNLLYKYSKKYKTDPMVSIAIAMQETGIRNIDRKTRALVKQDNGEVIKTVVTDVGIFQFHVDTIEYYNLDVQLIRSDLEYAVEQHIKLLKKKIKLCLRHGIDKDEAWSCYHSLTRKHRRKYVNDVSRYITKKENRNAKNTISKN